MTRLPPISPQMFQILLTLKQADGPMTAHQASGRSSTGFAKMSTLEARGYVMRVCNPVVDSYSMQRVFYWGLTPKGDQYLAQQLSMLLEIHGVTA